MRKRVGLIIAAAGCLMMPAACTSNPAPAQARNQGITNQIESAATHVVPYPLTQMEQLGWTEEKLIKEHLLREADPNSVRYITLLTQNGQVIATYTLKGMVFSPNSQMTESTDLACQGDSGGGVACGTVNSPSDNGTYGPEAGDAAFFTTAGAEIQIPVGMLWVESDTPQNFTTVPIITYNTTQGPPVNHGGLTSIGGR
jgi:hypothetical protein